MPEYESERSDQHERESQTARSTSGARAAEDLRAAGLGIRVMQPVRGISPAQILLLQRAAGNRAVSRLIVEERASARPSGHVLSRAAAVAPGPGGPDPCGSMLADIIVFLNTVAGRYNEAKADIHNLFTEHRTIAQEHSPYGSWEGHRNRYNNTRDELRRRLAEWDADDQCRGKQLTSDEAQDLKEAREWAQRDFPTSPDKGVDRSNHRRSGVPEQVKAGSKWAAVGGAIGGVIGGIAGALAGGAGGTAVIPGFGTVALGTAGALEGAAQGTPIGASIGLGAYWLLHRS